MTITAKVIADSYSPDNIRITTLQLRYPRFIHSEVMTHRVFSRNASSSRAIPVERLIEDVLNDTAMPMHWGKNQPGMQAREEHYDVVFTDSGEWVTNIDAWLIARDNAVRSAREFTKAGYHKQIVNRLLEPFSHINVLVTSTFWKNFDVLRNHPDAQPEICELAKQIKAARDKSEPRFVEFGDWHLPYVDSYSNNLDMIKVSVARCARVSYLTHDGRPTTIEEDLKLYDKLITSQPLHASPAEHQATPASNLESKYCGNFYGWMQYRKLLPDEFANDFHS